MSFLSLSFALWFLTLSSLRARYFLLARTITDINQNSDYAFLRIAIYTFGTLRMTCSHSHPHKWPIKWALARILRGTEREKWKKCIIYLSFFTAPPPLPSGQNYCSTSLTDQPSTTPPLSVWISGLNTEFRKGTRTAAQCRSPTPCSNSPSYSVPVLVPVSVLRILDSDTVDFVLFWPLASGCGHEFFFYNLDIWMITDKKLWKIDLSIKFYIWQSFLLFTSTAITVL